jgi:hypothetical protein
MKCLTYVVFYCRIEHHNYYNDTYDVRVCVCLHTVLLNWNDFD